MRNFITILFVAVTLQVSAQQYLEFNIKMYAPVGELNENIVQTPAGFNLGYWKHVNNSISLGGDFGVAMYSSDSYHVSTPDGPVEVEEEDCFITLHANSRYFIKAVPGFKPFVEGRVGLTTFFSTRVALEPTADFKDTFDVHGTAFNSALGAGFLTDFKQLFKKEPGSVLMNIGVVYHTGSKARYRNMRKSSDPSTPQVAGSFLSLTDYVDYRIGVAFLLK